MAVTRSKSSLSPKIKPIKKEKRLKIKKKDSWTDKKIIERFTELGQPASLTNAGKLAKELSLSRKRVSNALSKSKEIQFHTKTVRRFRRRQIVALPFHTISLDLKDLSSLSQFNGGYKFLLFCLDIGSRYLHVRPLKSKKATQVANALTDIFKSMKREKRIAPRSCYADQGSEFTNRIVLDVFKKHKIHFYTTSDPEVKAGAVEKSISTITQMIYRYFTLTNSFEYLPVLQSIVKTYNDTKNGVTGYAPSKVTVYDGNDIWHKVYIPYAPQAPKLKTGDYCFITRYKRIFTKGYRERLTGEIFRISDVMLTHPVTYKLVDLSNEPLKGSFYSQELVKTSKPKLYEIERILQSKSTKKGTQYLVKWKFYPDKFNSWINSKDVNVYKSPMDL